MFDFMKPPKKPIPKPITGDFPPYEPPCCICNQIGGDIKEIGRFSGSDSHTAFSISSLVGMNSSSYVSGIGLTYYHLDCVKRVICAPEDYEEDVIKKAIAIEEELHRIKVAIEEDKKSLTRKLQVARLRLTDDCSELTKEDKDEGED